MEDGATSGLAMAEAAELDALRAEIDRIDDAMLDLLMQRAEVVGRIAAAKQRVADAGGGTEPAPVSPPATGTGALRPQREAEILRRLLAKGGGAMPPQTIARIWREIIAAMLRLQGPFRVLVCAPGKSVGYWDLARSHFGSTTPMNLISNTIEAIRTLKAGGPDTVAVLPLPAWQEPQPWWPLLLTPQGRGLKVIGRLPFVENPEGRLEDLAAYIVGDEGVDSNGAEVTLLAAAAKVRQPPGSLLGWLKAAGLDGRLVAAAQHPEGGVEGAPWLHLVEVYGGLTARDPRLAGLAEASRGQIAAVRWLGGHVGPYHPA